MRHRIINDTIGLGNPQPCKLDNNITLEQNDFWDTFLEDCKTNFKTIQQYDGFDFHISEKGFAFGIEPSYKYDDLQIIYIDFNNINSCYIQQGRAWGYYGTNVITKLKYYGEYKRNAKFIRFINKWRSPIMEKLLGE